MCLRVFSPISSPYFLSRLFAPMIHSFIIYSAYIFIQSLLCVQTTLDVFYTFMNKIYKGMCSPNGYIIMGGRKQKTINRVNKTVEDRRVEKQKKERIETIGRKKEQINVKEIGVLREDELVTI